MIESAIADPRPFLHAFEHNDSGLQTHHRAQLHPLHIHVSRRIQSIHADTQTHHIVADLRRIDGSCRVAGMDIGEGYSFFPEMAYDPFKLVVLLPCVAFIRLIRAGIVGKQPFHLNPRQ
ncbi:hypothetical protein D3C76_1228930 [compost metagenome]